MSALTSLLARDQVVPVKKIEEAIQRQVISGGELDTVLLELAVLHENVMAAYCAAVHGLLPATRDEVMNVDRSILRIVPREVALGHRIVPIKQEGRSLFIAAIEPLPPETDRELGFLLGVDLETRIAPEVRVHAALAVYYEGELSPRMRRLGDKLATRDAGRAAPVAPLDRNVVERRPSLPGEEGPPAPAPDYRRGSAIPAKETTARFSSVANVATGERVSRPSTGSNERRSRPPTQKNVAASVASPEPRWSGPPPQGPAGAESPVSALRGGSDAPRVTDPGPAPAPVQAPAPTRPSAIPPRSAPSSIMPPPASDLVRRHRGPLTTRRAVELLSQAESRDDILVVALEFAAQFFDHAALFVAQDELAEGLDVRGKDADYARIQRVEIPLDRASTFKEAKDLMGPRVSLFDKHEIDIATVRGLGREEMQPAIVMPVAIKQRVVLFFYGDRAGEDFGLSDVPEILALLPRVSESLQSLIVRRKLASQKGGATDEAAKTAPKRWSEPKMPAAEAPAAPPTEARPPAHAPAPTPAPMRRPAPSGPMRAVTEGSEALQVLGVGRKAPPPPTSVARVVPIGEPAKPMASARDVKPRPKAPEGDDDPESTESPPLFADVRVKESSPGFARPSLEIVGDADEDTGMGAGVTPRSGVGDPRGAGSGDDADPAGAGLGDGDDEDTWSDDEPDIEVGEIDDEGDLHTMSQYRSDRPPPSGVGSYMFRGGSVEVVGKPGSPEPQPITPTSSPASRARRRDRRQDQDDGSHHDVVRLGPDSSPSVPPPWEVGERRDGQPRPDEPKVIVSMGDDLISVVTDLAECGPGDEEAALRRVLTAGEAALPVLVQYFPGPLWFDRHQPHRRLPRGRDVSAIARGIVAFGDRAIPYVVSLLDERTADVRFYATLLAAELPHADLVQPLTRRIFDEDEGTALLVLDVLRAFRRFKDEVDDVLEGLRATARIPSRGVPTRATAIRALGELRDERSLYFLLQMLGADERELAKAAHVALTVLTRQDFGETQRRWESWVDEHGHRHRIEWLIDALVHSDENIRRHASDELKQITQEYYGYHPSLSKKEREMAQKKYREWWSTEGQARFGG